MKETILAEPCNQLHVEAIVSRIAADLGLDLKALTLAKYAGCIHWHLRKPGQKGTLEITWWPEKDKVWVSLRENRMGDWIDEAVEFLVCGFHATTEQQN
ncbi:MAG TPA: hypothetical protein VGL56_09370 [Fimbriimonadaceae bacterium]|jgi:hypothetical protein